MLPAALGFATTWLAIALSAGFFVKISTDYLSKFKSPWYYWYAGYKSKAVVIIFACAAVSWLLLGLTAGFDVFLILILIALDVAGLILLLAYFLLLRPYIPDALGIFLDDLAMWHFIMAAVSVVINRLVTYFVACKVFKLDLVDKSNTVREPYDSINDAP